MPGPHQQLGAARGLAFREQGRDVPFPVHHRDHPRAGNLARQPGTVAPAPEPARRLALLRRLLPVRPAVQWHSDKDSWRSDRKGPALRA